MITFFFFLFAILAIVSAAFMVAQRNPVYSALFLILTFFSLAGLYFLLGAQFLGIIQIIVYAGAIMVLFLFVIMLLNLKHEARLPIGRPFQLIFGGIFSVLFLLQILIVVRVGVRLMQASGIVPDTGSAIGSVEALGGIIFTKYLFPFEAASVLLLVGMVGAIILGRKKLPNEY